jgi:hypothetical protein
MKSDPVFFVCSVSPVFSVRKKGGYCSPRAKSRINDLLAEMCRREKSFLLLWSQCCNSGPKLGDMAPIRRRSPVTMMAGRF